MTQLKYPKLLPQPVADNGDKTEIPLNGESGAFSYSQGFPTITQVPLSAGGVAPRRIDFNGIFNELSQHIYYQQSGGVYAWSNALDYPLNSIVYGTNNVIYKCIKVNGINSSNGARNPTSSTDYWKSFEPPIVPDNPLLYPGAFVTLYRQTPPTGFKARNGALISSAHTTVPKLYAELQKSENAWLLKTESQWQALQDASPWNGVGGAPFFVLNTTAKTIRLPDTRGMYEEGVGFDGMTAVGKTHGDMIRNIVGSQWGEPSGTNINVQVHKNSSGAFYFDNTNTFSWNGTGITSKVGKTMFSAAKVVPTGNANKPRAYAVLHCVYTG